LLGAPERQGDPLLRDARRRGDQRAELPSSGSGEPTTAAASAAIANAFFDATGVRIREAPMAPARVRAVLKAAGVA
jgi:CO/xanthine dehydrogenase Mo-binding subunit